MKRYLFVTWEGGGNVPPVLGTARQLVQRGHDVRVLTEPCLQEAVEAIGARFEAFPAPSPERIDRPSCWWIGGRAHLRRPWPAPSRRWSSVPLLPPRLFAAAARRMSEQIHRDVDSHRLIHELEDLVADSSMPEEAPPLAV